MAKPIQNTATSGEKIILRDTNDDILLMQGTTVPTNATTGYAKGCIFIDTDVATGTNGNYTNNGTNTSCLFQQTGSNITNLTTTGNTTIGDASADSITLNGTTTANAPITVGVDDTGYDVKLFGATSGAYMLWDESADDLILAGVAGLSVAGTSALGVVNVTGNTAFGVDGTGVDVTFFGDTASAKMLWDFSADALVFSGLAKLDIGASGTPLVLTEGTPIVEMYATCASTSGSTSAEPFVHSSVMTGAGGVGGRARFQLDTNVALGGWSNALKAITVYGASGSTTGLGSAFVAEMTLSAGTSSGTYAPLEVELNVPSGASLGTKTSLGYLAVNGADASTFDTSGYIFSINGLTAASGKVFQANTAAAATHALRIDIGGTDYFVMLTDTGA